MLKKSLVCVWSVCLLLQFTHALPLEKSALSSITAAQKPVALDKAKGNSSAEVELDSRLILLIVGVVGLTDFIAKSVADGRELFEKTVKELNALPDKSESLQSNITRLSDYLKETKDLNITDDPTSWPNIYESMEKLITILTDYAAMPEGEKLTETLNTAFEKGGLKKFEMGFQKRTFDFTAHFEEILEGYLAESTEKEKDSKLTSWFDKFKAEKDSEAKLLIFSEFFNIIM